MCVCIYIYIHIYMYVCVCVHMYIYVSSTTDRVSLFLSLFFTREESWDTWKALAYNDTHINIYSIIRF